MSLEEARRIGDMLRARPADMPLAERRAAYEARAAANPLPADYRDEPVTLAPGLDGLLVSAEGSDPSRVLLWLHGGAFMLGSPRSWRHFAARIARAAGVAVLLPDYRLTPEHPFPAAHEDALATLAWLDERGVDPARRAIGGDSAGANLALSALVARREAGLPLAAAAWFVSPYVDLTHAGASVAERAHLDPFIDTRGMDATARLWLGDADPRDWRASPLFADLAGMPPALVTVGSDEVLRDDAHRLAARLPAAHYQEWVGMMHVFPLFADLLEEGRWAIAQAGLFLRRTFATA